jgi:cytosolic prostaglandin-E synthase
MIMWAQRQGLVFLTICLEDCKQPDIKIEPNAVHFKGIGGTDMKPHEVTINLFKEVVPEVCYCAESC